MNKLFTYFNTTAILKELVSQIKCSGTQVQFQFTEAGKSLEPSLDGRARLCLKKKKKNPASWHQWLTPVNLVTQEAEIRKIRDQSQPGLADPILKNPFIKKGWWSGSRWSPEFKPQYWKKKK
jgi:hypothetical protein